MPLGSQSNTGHRPKDHRFLVLYFGCAMHSICSRCTALSARTVQQSLDASITEEPRNCEAPKNCSQEKCADEWKQGRDPTLAMQASFFEGPPAQSSQRVHHVFQVAQQRARQAQHVFGNSAPAAVQNCLTLRGRTLRYHVILCLFLMEIERPDELKAPFPFVYLQLRRTWASAVSS